MRKTIDKQELDKLCISELKENLAVIANSPAGEFHKFVQNNAARIWGSNWENNEYAKAFTAYTPESWADNPELSGMALGGMQGMQALYNDKSANLSMASAGIALQQWNLNYAFTTGVGLDKYAGIVNPQTNQPFGFNTGSASWSANGDSFTSEGGGTWGYQDAMTALGNSQQEFNFDMQSKQMEMQSRQFYENLSLNRRQSLMQRGWTRDDWNINRNRRDMQWGWEQEDFAENVRFMSG